MSSKHMSHFLKSTPQSHAFVAPGFGLSPLKGSFICPSKCLRSVSQPTRVDHACPETRSRYPVVTLPTCSSAASPTAPQSLSTWLSEKSAKLDKHLDIAPLDPRTKVGITVSAALLKGTELAVLPEAVFLTSRTAKSALETAVPNITGMTGASDLAPASWLALQLLYERSKGSESKFVPLLDVMPAVGAVDALPLWTLDQLEWLTGSPLRERALEVREGVAAEWESLKEELIPALLPASGEGELEMYRWAVGVVDARGVTVGGEILLAPIVAQCAPGVVPNARVELASGGFFTAKKTVKVVMGKDVEAGQEVCIDFGVGDSRVRNGDLLLERGLVVDDDNANVVEMSFSLTNMDRFYEDKIDIIEQYAMGGERQGDVTTFELDVGENVWEPPEGMDNFLRLLCLGGMDAFLLESVFRSTVWDHMGLPVSADNEKAVCNLVAGACEDALEGYQGSAVIPDGDNAVRSRLAMAEKIVNAEKSILGKVVAEYMNRVNSLDALEYYAERRLNELDLLRPVDECEIVDSDSGVRVGRAFDENYY